MTTFLEHHHARHADHHRLREKIRALAPDAVLVRLTPTPIGRLVAWDATAYARFETDGAPIPLERPGALVELVMNAKRGPDWDDPTRAWDLHVNSGIVRPAPERADGGEPR